MSRALTKMSASAGIFKSPRNSVRDQEDLDQPNKNPNDLDLDIPDEHSHSPGKLSVKR